MYILVFKTNISEETDLELIKLIFKRNLSILNWTIDFEDCDKVLRVESKKNNPKSLIKTLNFIQINCSEL